MSINYEKMQREFPKQKRALTLALKSGDYAKVVATTRKTIREWDETGAWPDDWARWERALDDAWWEAKQKYVRDEIEEMPDHVSMDDLRYERLTAPDRARRRRPPFMDRQELIWAVIEDIQDSYKLAMQQTAGLDQSVIDEVTTTVTDYAANNWGDD